VPQDYAAAMRRFRVRQSDRMILWWWWQPRPRLLRRSTWRRKGTANIRLRH